MENRKTARPDGWPVSARQAASAPVRARIPALAARENLPALGGWTPSQTAPFSGGKRR